MVLHDLPTPIAMATVRLCSIMVKVKSFDRTKGVGVVGRPQGGLYLQGSRAGCCEILCPVRRTYKCLCCNLQKIYVRDLWVTKM